MLVTIIFSFFHNVFKRLFFAASLKVGIVWKRDNRYVKEKKKKNGPYSPTILKNVLSLVLQIFLYLAAFKCNKTSDWLNHAV